MPPSRACCARSLARYFKSSVSLWTANVFQVTKKYIISFLADSCVPDIECLVQNRILEIINDPEHKIPQV